MNYTPMKKDELIKALKERDSVIAGFEETNKLLVKEKDDLACKVDGLKDDLKKSNEICERLTKEKDALRVEKNTLKTTIDSKDSIIASLKTQRVILLVAIAIAVIGIIAF